MINAVIDAELWNHFEIDAVLTAVELVSSCSYLAARLAIAAEFAVIDVVRPPVIPVDVAAILDHLHVVPQAFAAVLVMVDDVELFADHPNEPDSGRVANTDIPKGVNRLMAVVWQLADALLRVELGKPLGVIGAFD